MLYMNNGITYVRKDTKILFDPHKSVSEGIVCNTRIQIMQYLTKQRC